MKFPKWDSKELDNQNTIIKVQSFEECYKKLLDISRTVHRTKRYQYFENLSPNYKHILLACFPKSGSSFVREIVKNLPNMTQVRLTNGYDRREQELSPDELILCHNQNYIAQHHVRYSAVTEQLIRNFRLKPVILVRNLFDVVVSLYDHFHREGTVTPMAFVPEEWLKWDKIYALNFICGMVIPWYFNFYASWTLRDDKLIITYEELVKDAPCVISKISRYANIDCTDTDIEHAIKKTVEENKTRKNIGIIGRGASLPKEIKDKIYHMAEYYQHLDLSLIGL